MISYIITMLNNSKSIEASKKCVESARKFGYYPIPYKAITPEDDPKKIFEQNNLPLGEFKNENKYSRIEPAMCCFLSHRELWKKSVEKNEKMLVLEHDAIFKDKLPTEIIFNDFVNVGKPSYGNYRTPKQNGIYELFSKVGGYIPGTHAYFISPNGAKLLLDYAQKNPAPADLFLNKNNFPWLKECYPWPVEADDTFTTIQKVEGSRAKHNFNEEYEII